MDIETPALLLLSLFGSSLWLKAIFALYACIDMCVHFSIGIRAG